MTVTPIHGEGLRRLSRISNLRGWGDLALVWGVIVLAAVSACAIDRGWAYLLAAVVISSRQSALAHLAHEAWHRLCLRSPRWNDAVGAWLYAAPVGLPYFHDRERHLRHHRSVGRREDPDWVNYTNAGRETPRRLLAYLAERLAGGLLLSTLWAAIVYRRPRIAVDRSPGPTEPGMGRELLRIAAAQLLLFALMSAAFGWWSYPLLWLLPLATLTAFCSSLRAFVEHVTPTDDVGPAQRLRDLDASWLERTFLSPAHFHYHALHHAHPSIPHYALPRAKAELIRLNGRYPHTVSQGYLAVLRFHLQALGAAGPSRGVPEEWVRKPLPRMRAACDYCGSQASTPRTGMLIDVEGQESLPEAFRAERFELVRCSDCGLVYLAERPNPEDLDLYYSGAYKCFQDYESRGFIMGRLARMVARRKLAQIRELMPAGAEVLLDYGCGSGTWLALLREIDPPFRMLGTDITPLAVNALARHGIEGYCCDETGLFQHVEPGSIGVIHNFHVIEHVPSPRRMLATLFEALVPGGVLLGQTPNVASAGCRFFGDLWNQWHVPRHFVLFDHDTLRRHAESVGFEVVEISSSLSGATQWAQSALVWWAARRRRAFRGIDEPLYPALILACLPLVAVESLVSHTCHMDFVLRRPQ